MSIREQVRVHLDEGIESGNLVLCGGEDDVLVPLVYKRNVVVAVRESKVENLRMDDDLVERLHATREKNEVVESVAFWLDLPARWRPLPYIPGCPGLT
jgi:hypothetical protein